MKVLEGLIFAPISVECAPPAIASIVERGFVESVRNPQRQLTGDN